MQTVPYASSSALSPALARSGAAPSLTACLTAQATSPGWADLTPHRAFLVAYARRRLLDPALAEDLVHDVFEAVVSGRAVFGGRSALRSWLVAVLKHKIVDLIRERSGHASLDGGSDGDDDEAGVPELVCPQPRPEDIAEHRERLAQTLVRIAALPPTLRHAVELRLLHDGSSEDVCRALAIDTRNLFVRLHRARRALAS